MPCLFLSVAFLRFFLESAEQHNKTVTVKIAEDPENIRTQLDSYLKQSICALNIF